MNWEQVNKLKWRDSNWFCPHQYVLRMDAPELANEILSSKLVEVYRGRHYAIVYKDGFKYWVMGIIINRKREEPKDNPYPMHMKQ